MGDCSIKQENDGKIYLLFQEERWEKGKLRWWSRRSSTMIWREGKKRAEIRRLTSFDRFICEKERTLYLILLFIWSQWRDLRTGVMWWNLGVLVTARAAELRTSWRHKLDCLNAELLILGYKYSSAAEQIESEVITNSSSSKCFACWQSVLLTIWRCWCHIKVHYKMNFQ